MLEQYKTIHQDGQHEIEIKGSRFIAHFKRTETEEEALEFIQAIKKEHWKATHNCSAYLIGERDEFQRAMDDGEPSGTAGVPMLEVLKKQELKNTTVVVTRYFGGTKLGAGGLVRAYTGAVAEGLKAIGVVQASLETILKVTIDYSTVGKLEYYLETNTISVVDKEFTDVVAIHCSLPVEEVESFQESVIELLQNKVQFEELGQQYIERLISSDES